MTMREADEHAQKMTPVIYQDTEYLRIKETGYSYDEQGKRHPFIVLLDKSNHSVTYADPGRAELKEDTE